MIKMNRSGLTLVELIVATLILSIGVLAAVGSFQYISTSILHSKGRTLASNLCQEQVEKLKNLSYYTLLVTTSTFNDSRFNPSLVYDTGNYPAQTVVEGNISFTRATRVDFAYQNGSSISTAPWTTDDTALKQLTVYVIWNEDGDWKYLETQNLFANPAAVPLDAAAIGWVKNPSAVAVQGALVQIIDNMNLYGNADASGNYRFSVSPGSYTLQASSDGYYTSTTNGYINFTSGQSTTNNFTLTPISSGTATGEIFRDDHIVVSQVVATTDTADGVEYTELYNPTTAPVTIASAGVPLINFYVFDRTNNTVPNPGLLPVPLTYVNSIIPSHGFYLIANSPTINVLGATIPADAFYTGITAPTHLISQGEAGGLGVADLVPNKIDALAWSKNSAGHSCPATPMEGFCIPSANGLVSGEQLVRTSDPGALTLTNGRAYDTDNNSTDLQDIGVMTVLPNNSLSPVQNPTTGSPATGAVVAFNDPLSQSATCIDTLIGGTYRVCSFSLKAATGTWTMDVSSGSYYAQISNVTMQANVSTGVPNGSTIPNWTAVGSNNVTLLNDTTIYAFVSGRVVRNNGSVLSGIKVSDGNGRSAFSAANGTYSLLATTGSITLTSNPDDGTKNRSFTTESTLLTLNPATLYDNTNFTLELSGIIKGFFQTSSNTPLPRRVAIAQKTVGTDSAQAASDNSGYFYLANLSTGTYTVTPQLDTMETASPSSLTVVLASTGTTTTVSTFTITSGISFITGQVLIAASTSVIKTGTLIVASSVTIAGSLPPSQYGSTGASCSPCYYTASSDATGNYTLNVRNSATPYKLYGWYTSTVGPAPTIQKSSVFNVTVSTPGVTATQNISW